MKKGQSVALLIQVPLEIKVGLEIGHGIMPQNKIRMAIKYFCPYKSPSTDGIYPDLLQRARNAVTGRFSTSLEPGEAGYLLCLKRAR